jgi:hypothetical protein
MKRQGDLLIVPIDSLPAGLHPKEDRILAEGEGTGHVHELFGGDVYTKDEFVLFSVPRGSGAILKHPEHFPLVFEPGTYKVIRQREYRPQGWRHVSD